MKFAEDIRFIIPYSVLRCHVFLLRFQYFFRRFCSYILWSEVSRRACLSHLDHEVPSLRTIPLAWFQASRFSDKAQSSPCILRTCGPYPTPGRVDSIVLLSCRQFRSSNKETFPRQWLHSRHGNGTFCDVRGILLSAPNERIINSQFQLSTSLQDLT